MNNWSSSPICFNAFIPIRQLWTRLQILQTGHIRKRTNIFKTNYYSQIPVANKSYFQGLSLRPWKCKEGDNMAEMLKRKSCEQRKSTSTVTASRGAINCGMTAMPSIYLRLSRSRPFLKCPRPFFSNTRCHTDKLKKRRGNSSINGRADWTRKHGNNLLKM